MLNQIRLFQCSHRGKKDVTSMQIVGDNEFYFTVLFHSLKTQTSIVVVYKMVFVCLKSIDLHSAGSLLHNRTMPDTP